MLREFQWNIRNFDLDKELIISPLPAKQQVISTFQENSKSNHCSGCTRKCGSFAAIPAGIRTSDSAKVFLGIRDQASYWSSTEKDAGSAAAVGLGSQFLEVYFFNGLKADGYSVRCVRD